jgi:hypothetical protein
LKGGQFCAPAHAGARIKIEYADEHFKQLFSSSLDWPILDNGAKFLNFMLVSTRAHSEQNPGLRSRLQHQKG